MSCHVTSRHVTSRHVVSHHVTSRHFMSGHATSRNVMSCHVMSRPITSVMSRHVTSRHATSSHFRSNRSNRMANKHDIPLIPGIARVFEVRLLGVILTSSLSWSCQVDSILVAASQRLYLLNQLRHMSLDIVGLSNVFRSLVVSKMLYALPAISGSLNQSDINRLDALLRKAKRWGLTDMTETFGDLSDRVGNFLS